MCDVVCCLGYFELINPGPKSIRYPPHAFLQMNPIVKPICALLYVAVLGRTCQTSSPLSPLSDSSSPNKASRRLPSRNVKQFNFSDKKTQVQFIWFVDYRLNRLYIQARNICKSTTTTTVYFTLKAPGILIDRQNRNINKSKTPYQQ